MIEQVMDEEESALDCMPGSLQCSEKGEIMQDNIDELSSVLDGLREIIDK